ncbi:MAG TPA: carboxypeptidase-like regulatory domain-containing protein [Candidatus Paceibacterota bacterium]|nr:carboxypeptidase-like regulatory domain-containing protein [Candidatus Paceibacterota bacterium]
MHRPMRGVSLVDVVVGTFLVLVVFLALFGLLRASILVSSVAKSRATATSIASSQIEYVHSLSYDSVGTVGGIPPGVVPQYATTTHNGIDFVTRTTIQYVDDPADGTDASDVTGITTDYKRVRVAVTYTVNYRSREVALITNVVPPGLETSTGGGTLKIDVVSATGMPVAGASVRIENDDVSPAVDVTTFSNALGVVYLPGAATSTAYRVSVLKTGYSSAQTYARDAINQNPTPGYLTVAKDQTTTGTFAIDTLATLVLRTFSPIERATTTDAFDDASGIAQSTNVSVGSGALELSGTVGTYPSTGSARGTAVSPEHLAAWGDISAQISVPTNTTARVQVTDSAGTPLPDAVLPGNGTGFTNFPVSLSNVSTTTYPTLALLASLTSSDASTTPAVLAWSLSYDEGPLPLPDVGFSLVGTKTIGSTGAGEPLHKSEVSDVTGADGTWNGELEWDVYTLSIEGYDVVDACGAPPFTLPPGTTSDNRLMLGDESAHMILISVRDTSGAAIEGASVTLSQSGYASTKVTGACGTAYFGDLISSTAYTVEVVKSGYALSTHTPVSVSGKTFYAATLE